jgi:hypothetical protein
LSTGYKLTVAKRRGWKEKNCFRFWRWDEWTYEQSNIGMGVLGPAPQAMWCWQLKFREFWPVNFFDNDPISIRNKAFSDIFQREAQPGLAILGLAQKGNHFGRGPW